ncbi:MAG: NADP-dependent oxidoreductase [Rhodobacteraceae bacterium]|jgi:NADPH:quinone reductase-like Zn-dependent oxidoreductase|uniref:Zn-dependent oxidoreductase, NADPH:quinone reductase n=2 Tax=Salipiger profundus TaxID=1229727 RepID=A0A1U7D5H7_9RHOB|nr:MULTISPECIES: NADP-dependent oxidoreductase [Salipiger]APX23424.1 Zn-dependent oxidoreductase, NADPH:quinone reductase [Salipiger profundus]MAB06697.1 NADP-dependent oxidoreductase [Paracoccaceae bacterium]GGA28962.1 NADPH:quinone reductase [Salipiger profundus]SFD89814.1 NADPH:quinone reductase [Salipiger profundus]
MTQMMKAVRQHSFGGPDVLTYEDAPIPEPAKGEIRIRVKAASLNPPDWYLRDGYSALPPEWRPEENFPLILGTDVSGVVDLVGEHVTGFTPGDEVYSMMRFPDAIMEGSGAYAEYVLVPAAQVGHKPDGIDHVAGAGAPMSLLTAWQFLVEVGHDAPNPFQPVPHVPVPLKGKRVLVNGAAGGVGHLALQVAKWQGAHVIAVASGLHDEILRDLGADEVIDYTQVKPEEVSTDLDLVLDCVGGAAAARFLACMNPGGALFIVNPLGFDGKDEADRLGITVSSTQVRSSGAQLDTVAPLLADGTIRVVTDTALPLAEAARAHERAAEGHIQGKIVLTID